MFLKNKCKDLQEEDWVTRDTLDFHFLDLIQIFLNHWQKGAIPSTISTISIFLGKDKEIDLSFRLQQRKGPTQTKGCWDKTRNWSHMPSEPHLGISAAIIGTLGQDLWGSNWINKRSEPGIILQSLVWKDYKKATAKFICDKNRSPSKWNAQARYWEV